MNSDTLGIERDVDKGYSCDDYHQLIATRVQECAVKFSRDIDYIEIGTFYRKQRGRSSGHVPDS